MSVAKYLNWEQQNLGRIFVFCFFFNCIFTILPCSGLYQPLFSVQYIKGASAVIIVSKKVSNCYQLTAKRKRSDFTQKENVKVVRKCVYVHFL